MPDNARARSAMISSMLRHYEDGRNWLALASRPIGEANASIVDALAREDEIIHCIEHTKAVIAALDKARATAQRAVIHFEMAREEEKS